MSKLIAFEIPESPDEIAKWLETIICEGGLRSLVAQLIVVHGVTDKKIKLASLLGADRHALLTRGLTALPISKIQSLLLQPTLLFELQEAVMADGGDYWVDKFKPDGGQQAAQRTADVITEILEKTQVNVDRSQDAETRWSISTILTLAAGLLIAVGGTWYWTHQKSGNEPIQVAIGWGWASESGIPTGGSPKEYLISLSNGADAWFKKRPANPAQLVTRLTEFSAGCEQLIRSNHVPLADGDRAWLVFKCRGWKKRIDEQLAAADQNPVEIVINATDKIAKEISDSLRERAFQV